MTQHPLKDITFVHCMEKPHVFPSETSKKYKRGISIFFSFENHFDLNELFASEVHCILSCFTLSFNQGLMDIFQVVSMV